MAKKDLPDIETLRQLLRYEPETGNLYWLPRTLEMCNHSKYPKRTLSNFNSRFANKKAGYITHQDYVEMVLVGNPIGAHIVCWSLYYGYIPKLEIDHINGDRKDNRICNLREATDSQQQSNKAISSKSTTGHKGIYSFSGRWRAKIYHNNKSIHLGMFNNFDEAVAARKAAEAKHHGEYVRNGD